MDLILALKNAHLDTIVTFNDKYFIVVGIQMLTNKTYISETLRPYYYLTPIDGTMRINEEYSMTVSGHMAICIPHEKIESLTLEEQETARILYDY